MAEVIGIAGGIISLTGLVKQLIIFHDFIIDLRDAPEDIRYLTTELEMLRFAMHSSSIHSQQIEIQGEDAEEFRSLLLVMSEWLQEVEQTLKDCTANARDGKMSRLGKRIRSLHKKKKIDNKVAMLARMQLILSQEKFNTER